jgi:CDP-diacylglycerol--glycerol-3-phosphate 3-phosphatidyltransferase
MSEQPVKTEDFVGLRRSDARRGPGLLLGTAVVSFREAVAAGLAAWGVSPHAVTWTAFAVSAAAAVCFLLGAGHAGPWVADGPVGSSWWPMAGAALLLASAGLDMLDGALARARHVQSDFGAVLDSTLDRVSELLVYGGCAAFFALHGNATYVALSMLAFGSSALVSYVKARVENFGVSCRVGYWQRGERMVLFVVAAAAGHVPAALWMFAIGPWFTVVRRVRHGRALLVGSGGDGTDASGPEMTRRYPRGSLGYDLSIAILVAFLIVAPWVHPLFSAAADPLRALAGSMAPVGQ